jgi:hypothetical protein
MLIKTKQNEISKKPVSIVFFLPGKKFHNIKKVNTEYFLTTELAWVYQTFDLLQAAGKPVKLSNTLPDKGIIITLSGLIDIKFLPNPDQFYMAISADNCPAVYAQMRIVQNRMQTKHISDSFFLPHWPQPGLIPRNPSRRNLFERAAFFGDNKHNLAKEFQTEEWRKKLANLGLEWCIRNEYSPKCLDYSDIDVVIAVRDLNKKGFIRKPPSKLYNCWIAAVPAVLGSEYAFQEERQSNLDYIEVSSVPETLKALSRLKNSPELRSRMTSNGLIRSSEIQKKEIIKKWWDLIDNEAMPKFEKWKNMTESKRKKYILKRKIDQKIRNMRHRLFKVLCKEHNCI